VLDASVYGTKAGVSLWFARIITTLAAAWPHLTNPQQVAVKQYVRAELGDERRAPWTPKGFIPPDKGARRESHGFNEARGWDRFWAMWGAKKPIMGGFYGLWLYAYRSADWEPSRPITPGLPNSTLVRPANATSTAR